MTLRARLVLVAAAAVAVSVVLASGVVYFLVSGELHRQVNSELAPRLTLEHKTADRQHRAPCDGGAAVAGIAPE